MRPLPTSALEDAVAAKRTESWLPGVAAGIVADDGLAWFTGQGWADIETRTAPAERSLGRVASVTKTFTATAILQMRDRGLLGLDDPLERHIPEFAAVQERAGRRADVTIRRLLTHRSGLMTESPPTQWEGPNGAEFPSTKVLLAALQQTAIVIPPDSAFKYSNLAFALLGEAVARLSGRSYVDHVQAEIFDPLGMTDSTFEPNADQRRPAMTGYSPGNVEDAPSLAPTTSLDGLTSAGQLYTNVRDLSEWVAFQLRGDGRSRAGAPVLSEDSVAQSFRAQTVEPDFVTGQCLAWRLMRVGEHVFHNHGGSVHGFNTSVGFHRPSRLGVVVLTNLWPTTAAAELAFELLEMAVSGTPRSAWSEASTTPPSPVPDEIRPFLGRYRAEPGIVLDVEWRDGALRFASPPRAFPLHTPALLEAIGGRDRACLVRTGRGAGEEVEFAEDGRSFALGGFVYRRG